MKNITIEEWRELPETGFDDVKIGKSKIFVKTTGYIFTGGIPEFSSYTPPHTGKDFSYMTLLQMFREDKKSYFNFLRDMLTTLPGEKLDKFKHKISFHMYEKRHDDGTPVPRKDLEVTLSNGERKNIPIIEWGLQPGFKSYKEGNIRNLGRDLDEIAAKSEPITIGGLYNPKENWPFFNLKYLRSGNLELII